MIFFYRSLAKFAVTLLTLLRTFLPKKLQRGLDLRAQHVWMPMSGYVIWFHCASGEFEYAKPVIRELKAQHPKLQIVLTYFSPSVEISAKQFELLDQCGPMPWDLPSEWRAFFETVNPKLLLVARTDLWPEMLVQAQKNKVPRVLFSATASDSSSWFAKIYKRWVLGFFNSIFVVGPLDLKSLNQLGLTQVKALGDTRYDQVAYRLTNTRDLDTRKKPQQPCLVAGSTWLGDETCLIPAVSDLLKQKKLQLILVPHEPSAEHLLHLEGQCSKLGLRTIRYSSTAAWDDDKHVLLVDKVGILADLYTWGTLAYVGGSMDRKVHSVMEPLAAGLVTFVGPNIQNNREALEFSEVDLGGLKAVTVGSDIAELSRLISQALILIERRPSEISSALRSQVQERQGASAELARQISSWL